MGAVMGIIFLTIIAVSIALAASGNVPGGWTGFNLEGEGKVLIEPKGSLEATGADPLQVLGRIEGVERVRTACDSIHCAVEFRIDLEVMKAWEEGKE